MRPQDTSPPVSMILCQFAENIGRFLDRRNAPALKVLIFIQAMLHAAAKPFNACCRLYAEEANKFKSTNLASSDRDTLIVSAELGRSDHVN